MVAMVTKTLMFSWLVPKLGILQNSIFKTLRGNSPSTVKISCYLKCNVDIFSQPLKCTMYNSIKVK